MAISDVPITALAAAFGSPRSLVGGEPGVVWSETQASLFGAFYGMQTGAINAAKAFATEESQTGKLDMRRRGAIPSVTLRAGATKVKIGALPIPFTGEVVLGGKQVRVSLRALTASDEFFKSIAVSQSIAKDAAWTAAKERLTGDARTRRIAELIKDPTEKMLKSAKEFAQQQTFTRPLTGFARDIQKWSNRSPLVKILFLPFTGTPANLFKKGVQHTIFAPIFDEYRADLFGKNGPRAQDMARARIAYGSLIAVAAVQLVAQGLVTGGGPEDPQKRAALYESGWRPYSFHNPIDGAYYPILQLFEPFSTIVGTIADFIETVKALGEKNEKKALDSEQFAALLAFSAANNLTNKSYMQSVADTIGAVQDPERYAENWTTQWAASLVPTGVANYARATDPFIRQADDIVSAMKARIPGLSQTLPRKLSPILGEPIRRDAQGIAAFLFGAAAPSAETKSPVVKEIVRLDIRIPAVPKDLEGVKLTPHQRDLLAQNLGYFTKSVMELVINAPRYKAMGDDLKRFYLDKAISAVRTRVTEGFKQFEDINAISDAAKVEMYRRMMRGSPELFAPQPAP